MPSLKDMRVRIASTKATQKITKAMQMVAASKLRRAQTAAEAARPYAEKMDAVISNIATAAAGSPGAPVLLAGTGKDQVHLLLVCTGERGLSGAFNSSIVRLARERALSLMNQGKEVKFFCVGRKGYEQLRRTFDKQIVEHLDLRSVRQLAFSNAEDIAKKMRAAHLHDWKEAVKQGVITQAEGDRIAAAHEAVAKVIEVDDFAPEALSPIYKKPAEVHQFFQELGETRAAS